MLERLIYAGEGSLGLLGFHVFLTILEHRLLLTTICVIGPSRLKKSFCVLEITMECNGGPMSAITKRLSSFENHLAGYY